MGQRFLIDTNVLIYASNNTIPKYSQKKVVDIFDNSFVISIISEIEYLGWDKFKSEELVIAKKFLSTANVINVTTEIKDLSIKLKQQFGLKLADAIIGATAICHSLTLVTRNNKDFYKIENLSIYNPFE